MTLFEISPQGAKSLSDRLQAAKEGLDLSYFVNRRPAMTIDASGIASIWLYGPLLKNAAPVERDLGATDYTDLAAELAAEGVRGILLHVDSPGGTVAGCIEVAKLVEAARVPVVVHCAGLACSAAYKIACGADWIVVTQSATVGNIGTILVYADTCAMMENLGVSLNAIVNDGAALKSTGASTASQTSKGSSYRKASTKRARPSRRTFKRTVPRLPKRFGALAGIAAKKPLRLASLTRSEAWKPPAPAYSN